MFTLRQRIFIISGIAVAVVLIIVLSLLYIRPKTNTNNNPANDNTSATTTNENVVDANNPNIIFNSTNQDNQNITKPDGTPEELFVKQLARIFVERFFTYSNQNNNINIQELENSVTAPMFAWMNLQAPENNVAYSGITTHVLSTALSDFNKNNGTAKVSVDANQLISKDINGTIQQTTEQKKFEINFELSGSDWKVSGVWDRTSSK
ncbi:MAG: hypothetical protein WC025_03555 [Candidatus Magasanikbacteria bacterium]